MKQPQLTLSMESEAGFERHRKRTRRDAFLGEMDKVVGIDEERACMEPFHPMPRGREVDRHGSQVNAAHPPAEDLVRAQRPGDG